jgi:tRNA modification GTPase
MSSRAKNLRSNDTIAAVATPSGVGGIHVVRLSGPDSRRIADSIFVGRTTLSEAPSHTAHHGNIVDRSTGKLLDDVIAVLMWEPRSYTCEDTVEFSTHGSPYISGRLVEMLIANGARLAEPGEFTLRAFLNGRLDLSQAEAVADLIAARTESGHRIALAQLAGNLSNLINQLRDNLLTSLSLLEAYTDFPEEDIELSHYQQVKTTVELARGEIDKLLNSFDTGRILRDGLRVPIIGPPNSGKSSLFNYLLDHDRAIVFSEPGTTRDTISECISIGGLTVQLTDTAGLHDSCDPVENAGVERSMKAIDRADVLIALVDGTSNDLVDAVAAMTKRSGNTPILCVVNKVDLLDDSEIEALRASLSAKTLYISALRGNGIEELRQAVLESVFPGGGLREDDEIRIASIRHKAALLNAKEQLGAVALALSEQRSHEFVAFDLKLAMASLGEITGEITADEVLNRIFSDFCIGK